MTAEVASYNALVAYTPVDDMRVGSYNALIAFTIPDEVSLASYNALIAYYIEEQANSNLTTRYFLPSNRRGKAITMFPTLHMLSMTGGHIL
jgi:hypothetical protein